MNWLTPPLDRILLAAGSGTWGSEPDGSKPTYPVLRSTNIQDGRLRFESTALRSVSEKTAAKYLLREGDILVTTSSGSPQHIGRNAVVRDLSRHHGRFLFSNFTWRLRADPKAVIPKYLYYYLNSRPARAVLDRIQSTTSGLRNLNTRLYLTQQVPLPTLSEQRRIVEILDQADHLRRLRTESDTKAGRILPALFLKIFGDPTTNPMGWPVKRFDSICKSRLGKMLDARQQTGLHRRAYLRNANVYWDRLALDELREMDFDEVDQEEFRLRPGDVLICEGGEVGRSAIWNGELPDCYFQKALHRARPFPEVAVSEFVVYLLWELAKRGALRSATSQVTFSHLTGVKLKALRVPVPPLSLQRSFADRVRLFKRAVKGSDSVSRLDSLFTTLLHSALSGSLTAVWRLAHVNELLHEMDQQAKALPEA